MANNAKLLYMHIPKTAGTSLTNYLQSRFPTNKSSIHSENVVFEGKKEAIENLEDYHLVTAHLKLPTLERVLDLKKFFTIALFREPVDQIISHLAWIKRLGDPQYERELESHPNYIKEIVERISNNDIVHFLDTLGPEEKSLYDNCQTRYLLPVDGETSLKKSHLEEAILAMNTLDLVGVTEKFNEFIALLSYCMCWKVYPVHAKSNVSDPKYLINLNNASTEVIARISKLTRFDKKIYQHARNLFENKLRQAIMGVEEEFPELNKFSREKTEMEAFIFFLNRRSNLLNPRALRSVLRSIASKLGRLFQTPMS